MARTVSVAVILIAARGLYFIATMLLFGSALFRVSLRTKLKIAVPGPLFGVTLHGDRIIALLAGVALALPAVTSHAAKASPAGFLAIGATLDAIHLLTAGFWIGGLAVLVQLRRHPDFAAVLTLFSDLAMIAVLLLVMTGFTNTAMVVLGGKGHVATLYLRVLLAKLALVTGMLVLALVNRLKLMDGGTGTIARNAAIELAMGAGAILLAGALGQLTPTV